MNCIIIEDEIPAQNILKNYINKIPDLDIIATFNSATEAHLFFKANTTDLVFLDINLPDISGIDFIKTVTTPPIVIMTTAYPNYAANSFELDTIADYLVKPFSFDRFLKSINKAKRLDSSSESNETTGATNTFFLNVDKTLHKITIDEILYIESDRNYITVASINGKLTYLDTLRNWIEKLPQDFVQVHKSFLINTKHISKISGNELYINSHKIPIGRTYKKGLLHILNI